MVKNFVTLILTSAFIFTINKGYTQEMIELKLATGTVKIELFEDKAPAHIAQIKELMAEGYYDGKLFHRVIDGFMAQTGSPNGDGIGGSEKPDLKAEFNDVKHERGVVSMARTGDPDSANAQFFIMLANAPHLDGQYTAWGRVTSGMQYVDLLKKGKGGGGTVSEPDEIVSMKLVE